MSKAKQIDVFGVHYVSIKEACRVLNVSFATVTEYKKSVKSWDIAFKKAIDYRESLKCTVFGVDFRSLNSACEHYKVCRNTIKSLSEEYGLDEAFTIAIQRVASVSDSYIVFGVDYKSASNAYKHFKVSAKTMERLVKESSSLDEAYTKLIDSRKYLVLGEDLLNFKNACKVLCVSQFSVRSLLEEGYTRDDAFKEALSRNTYIVYGVNYKNQTTALKHFNINQQLFAKYREDYPELCLDDLFTKILNRWKVEYRGVTYKTKKEVCEVYGVLPGTVLRIEKKEKCNFSDALDKAIVLKKDDVVYKGKKYRSVNTLCSEMGVQSTQVYGLLSSGVFLEEAVDIEVAKKVLGNGVNDVFILGSWYTSKRSACKLLGANISTVDGYISDGDSLDVAFTKAINNSKDKKSYIVLGKDYKTRLNACKVLGVSRSVVDKLLKEYDVDTAFTKAMEGNGITVFGVYYKNTLEASKVHEVSVNMVRKYLRNGLSPDDAFTKALNRKELYLVAGVGYTSFKNACNVLDVSTYIVSKFLEEGYARDIAFELASKEKGNRNTLCGYRYTSKKVFSQYLGLKELSLMGKKVKLDKDILNREFRLNIFKSEYVEIVSRSYRVDGVYYYQCVLGSDVAYLSAYELLDYILECLYKEGKIEKVGD